MKKSIFLIGLIAGFFLLSTSEVSAQWSADVFYDDSNCDCGELTGKTIEWELKDLVIDKVIGSGSTVLSFNDPHELSGTETLVANSIDRYLLSARITYSDAGGMCCTGWDSGVFDGNDLINGVAELDIVMD